MSTKNLQDIPDTPEEMKYEISELMKEIKKLNKIIKEYV